MKSPVSTSLLVSFSRKSIVGLTLTTCFTLLELFVLILLDRVLASFACLALLLALKSMSFACFLALYLRLLSLSLEGFNGRCVIGGGQMAAVDGPDGSWSWTIVL